MKKITTSCLALATLASIEINAQSLPSSFPADQHNYHNDELRKGAVNELVKNSITFAAGAQTIQIAHRDRPSTGSTWNASVASYSVSYFILDCAVRSAGEEVFVSGMKPNGDTILEKWTFDYSGRIGVRYPTAPEPIGTAMATVHPAIAPIGGGYTAPSGSGRGPAPQRVVIYEGTLPAFTSLVADMEGRYLLLSSRSAGTVHRLDLLGPGSSPIEVLTTLDVPSLDRITSMVIANYEGEGRVVRMRTDWPSIIFQHDQFILWRDSDNDGVFESASVMTSAEYLQSAYLTSDDKWDLSWEYDV